MASNKSKRTAVTIMLFCAFLALASQAYADDCGGVTAVCACGDTVITDYNLMAPLGPNNTLFRRRLTAR